MTKAIPPLKSFIPLDEEESYYMSLPLHSDEEITDWPTFDSFVDAAESYTTEKKAISLKMPVGVLAGLKAIGKRDAIPYQTLLISIAKRYVEGRLVEKE